MLSTQTNSKLAKVIFGENVVATQFRISEDSVRIDLFDTDSTYYSIVFWTNNNAIAGNVVGIDRWDGTSWSNVFRNE